MERELICPFYFFVCIWIAVYEGSYYFFYSILVFEVLDVDKKLNKNFNSGQEKKPYFCRYIILQLYVTCFLPQGVFREQTPFFGTHENAKKYEDYKLPSYCFVCKWFLKWMLSCKLFLFLVLNIQMEDTRTKVVGTRFFCRV